MYADIKVLYLVLYRVPAYSPLVMRKEDTVGEGRPEATRSEASQILYIHINMTIRTVVGMEVELLLGN